MSLDRNVRSTVVINQKGEMLHKEMHQGFVQPSLERWNDIYFMECTFEISMGGQFDEIYGPIRYHYSEKDNFIMFSFPLHKNVVLVTCLKKVSPIAFATEVSHIINKVVDGILHE
jgi:hypothetical protein